MHKNYSLNKFGVTCFDLPRRDNLGHKLFLRNIKLCFRDCFKDYLYTYHAKLFWFFRVRADSSVVMSCFFKIKCFSVWYNTESLIYSYAISKLWRQTRLLKERSWIKHSYQLLLHSILLIAYCVLGATRTARRETDPAK